MVLTRGDIWAVVENHCVDSRRDAPRSSGCPSRCRPSRSWAARWWPFWGWCSGARVGVRGWSGVRSRASVRSVVCVVGVGGNTGTWSVGGPTCSERVAYQATPQSSVGVDNRPFPVSGPCLWPNEESFWPDLWPYGCPQGQVRSSVPPGSSIRGHWMLNRS